MAKQISDAPRVAPANLFTRRRGTFVWLALLLVALAILRSAITTCLDGFTIDEAYHITAGVSYLKYHDFRINPEHPPLVKLWVGVVMYATGFRLDSLRQFNDKPGERAFANLTVFRQNDPDSVQRRARVAMYGLNGLLLLALAFALERVFNAGVSLGTLLFLAIDPTVAAHLPVVMTDLPVALLSTTAVVLTARAFRDWIWTDLAACSVFLGLALTAKHSAPVVAVSITLIGAVVAIVQPLGSPSASHWFRFLKLGAVLAGAMLVLWASYMFRYSESPAGQESFVSVRPTHLFGILQTDGYTAYDQIGGPKMVHAGCWAHSRRLFFEAVQLSPSDPFATPIVARMDELFAIDAEARRKALGVAERHVRRQERAKPVLDEIRRRIETAHFVALPSSVLSKACHYALGLWKKLTRFLEYPELELSTNLAENSMRAIALGRNYVQSAIMCSW